MLSFKCVECANISNKTCAHHAGALLIQNCVFHFDSDKYILLTVKY